MYFSNGYLSEYTMCQNSEYAKTSHYVLVQKKFF